MLVRVCLRELTKTPYDMSMSCFQLFSMWCWIVGQPSNQQEVDAGDRCVEVGVSPPCMLPDFDRDGVNM